MNPLFETYVYMTNVSQAWLIPYGFVFLRVAAALSLAPVFGETAIPQRVKLGAACAVALLATPAIDAPKDLAAIHLLTEIGNGLLLGIGFRVLVTALQTAGAIAGQATSLSHLFISTGAEPQSAFSGVFLLSGLALACSAGLHVQLTAVFVASYELIPIGRFPTPILISEWGLDQVSRCFALGVSLAAPFVLSGLLYNISLGAMNRAMPTLMVLLVVAPALSLGGLILLAVCTPFILTIWLSHLGGHLTSPFFLGP